MPFFKLDIKNFILSSYESPWGILSSYESPWGGDFKMGLFIFLV